MDNHYFILEGKEVKSTNDILVWAKQFKSTNRIVAKTDLKNGVSVSTVFLGTNHAFEGKPLVFETMIFGGEHDEFCMRYSTWEEAEQGHQRAIALAEKE